MSTKSEIVKKDPLLKFKQGEMVELLNLGVTVLCSGSITDGDFSGTVVESANPSFPIGYHSSWLKGFAVPFVGEISLKSC